MSTNINRTDCRTKDGITVSLIDSLMSICRVLAPRLRRIDTRMDSPVVEALKDLGSDEDLNAILDLCPASRSPEDEAKLCERVKLSRTANRSTDQESRLRDLDLFASKLPYRSLNSRPTFDDLIFDLAKDLPGFHGVRQ